MRPRLLPFLCLLLAPGCATGESLPATPAAALLAQPPAGSTIEPSGFATITDAPPAPFEPAPPGEPPPLTPAQIAGHRQFARAGAFQNSVMDEVT
ncbi:MAG TPA: hypothetical protein VGX37_13340, partial [Allosphingosinicella sp.]|nr:hypothetical protein [Allosphingosinicella sp.]